MTKKADRLRLTIMATVILYASLIIAAVIRVGDKPFRLDSVLLSDILSTYYNPDGAWVAILGINLCAILLFFVTSAFKLDHGKQINTASIISIWIFRFGIISTIALSITSLFDHGEYNAWHVGMAYGSYMGVVGGLAVVLTLNFLSKKNKRSSLISAIILIASFFIMAYLVTQPDFFYDMFWMLALFEWLLITIIMASIFQVVLQAS